MPVGWRSAVRALAGLRRRRHAPRPDAAPSELRDAVENLIRAWSEDDSDAVLTDEALTRALGLLAEAWALDDGDVLVDPQSLATVAWLFWARWESAEDGVDRLNLDTALPLFLLLTLVDPGEWGDLQNLPEQVRTALAGEETPASPTLLGELAVAVVDGWGARTDPVVLARSVRALTEAALHLTPVDGPDVPHYLATSAAAHFAAYRRTGDRTSLDDAVDACRRAVDGCRDEVAARPHLLNLAIGLRERSGAGGSGDLEESLATFDRLFAGTSPEELTDGLSTRALAAHGSALLVLARTTGDGDRLDQAVDRFRAAAVSVPATPRDPIRLARRTDLAEVLRERHDAHGDPSDLEEALALATDVVEQTAPGDPDRPRRQCVLASVSSAAGGDPDRAVELHETALRAVDGADPLRRSILTNLGHVLVARHERTGGLRDLGRGVAAQRLAACRLPDWHPLHPTVHGNLGVALAHRYHAVDRAAVLDDAVAELRIGLSARAVEPARRATLLANLSGLLLASVLRGHRDDGNDDRLSDDGLSEAVSAGQEAVDLTLASSPDLSRRLVNLALAQGQRFHRSGDGTELDESIATHRRACDAAPPEPRVRAHHLGALAAALATRHWAHGSSVDLDEAVATHRDAVATSPATDPDRDRLVGNLASALLERSRVRGVEHDARESMRLMRGAVERTRPGGVDLPYRLDTLATALARVAELSDDDRLAADAVDAAERAIARTATTDDALPDRLRHLADAHELRHGLSGDPAQLDAAVDAAARAVTVAPEGSPIRALNQHELARLRSARADRSGTGTSADRASALAAWRDAALTPSAPVGVRLTAAEAWGQAAVAAGDHVGADHAFALAVELVPRLGWLGLPRSDRERQLAEWPDLAVDAAASALRARAPGRAVELLEAARSVMWRELLQLDTDLDRLNAEHRDLGRAVERHAAAIRLLERPPRRDRTPVLGAAGTGPVATPLSQA